MISFKYKPPIKIPASQISRLRIAKMKGRLLHLPAKKKKAKTIVLLYGQHSAHERLYAVAQLLNDYGEVYSPDLPGFGGMTSFYSIGKKPTYDEYADYLYSFLKSKKLTKDVWFFANSFSSQILTRMYQRHPDSQKWTKQAIAFVGLAAGDNFNTRGFYKAFLHGVSHLASTTLGSTLMWLTALNPISIRIMLNIFSKSKAKMQNDNENLKSAMIEMEGYLWQVNHLKTHGTTAIMMFNQDLRKYTDKKIKLTLHNVITEDDQYFDNTKVEKAFRDLYEGYETSPLNLHVHAPSMIASKEDVRKMLSKQTINLLKS